MSNVLSPGAVYQEPLGSVNLDGGFLYAEINNTDAAKSIDITWNRDAISYTKTLAFGESFILPFVGRRYSTKKLAITNAVSATVNILLVY